MSQKAQHLNGLWLIDKPPGMTSHDVVNRMRKILGTKSVGHSGTLDPLASGLMVVLIGQGTRLSPYILEG
ncbi:MAG: tRNA pseudouridine(55) synthase TruB, partial [Bdellovibrionales bacterium]|nr:tRNA pseudouridine(55) synthase TruB [Bdellovibrionales bacterium]